jgi:hypothetical protein
MRRTVKYASFLRTSGALHLCIFDQPEEENLYDILIDRDVNFT